MILNASNFLEGQTYFGSGLLDEMQRCFAKFKSSTKPRDPTSYAWRSIGVTFTKNKMKINNHNRHSQN